MPAPVFRRLLFLVPLLGVAAVACAQPAVPDTVRTSIRARIEAGENRSIVVALVDASGATFYSDGQVSAADTSAPDEHTLFEIGSITKVFTALLLADMAARGEVGLDDPIGAYLPHTLRVPGGPGGPITLRHLASQTSGLPRMPTNFAPADPTNPFADYTVEQLYAFLDGYALPRAPGAAYEYSNYGVGLLGHLLARKAGTTYEALLVERVLAPLGLDETRITLDAGQRARLAPGHSGPNVVPNWDLPTLAGAGALRSSAHDLLRFVATNAGLAETPLYAAMQATHAPVADAGTPEMKVALGWHVRPHAGGATVWHNGGTGGYRSFAGFDPERRRGAVVLTNSDLGVDDLGFHLLDETFPLRPVKRALTLPAEVLDRYVGVYELAPQFLITVSRDGEQLMGQLTGQPAFALYADAETHFFLRVVDAQVTFHRDADGQTGSLTLHQNGRDMPAKKIR